MATPLIIYLAPSNMSGDEVIVTVGAVLLGPVLWTLWLFQMSRAQTMHRRRVGVMPVAAALLACAGLLLFVLRTRASFDVVDAPQYQFMYLVLGLAWLRVAQMLFPYAGLSPRDDVIERRNGAASWAYVGALIAVTLCYAGGNVGDGPGWWVVVFAAGLATGTLLLAWAMLAQLSPVADAVTIDRDPAAGVRLAAFLVSCGLILYRGVAGDWESAAATVSDFVAVLPAVVVILALAVVVERLARPTPGRPHAPFPMWGVLPSLVYLVVAINALRIMQWPV